VIYDIEIVDGRKRLLARLALNQEEDGRFSIACRKTPGGTLFTYWATTERNVLSFPKDKIAFSGDASQPFRLFPGGPELDREQWLSLLGDAMPGELGRYTLSREAGWTVLRDPESDSLFVVRWRERKRLLKDSYSEKVLTPFLPADTLQKPLRDLSDYWIVRDGI
jgi:hypothetical protein